MKKLFAFLMFFAIVSFFSCKKNDTNVSNDLKDLAIIPFNTLNNPRLLAPSNVILKKNVNMAAYLLVTLNHHNSKYVINDSTLAKVCNDLNTSQNSPTIYDAFNFLKKTENVGINQEVINSFSNTEQGKKDWMEKVLASLKDNKLIITYKNGYPVVIYGISLYNDGDGLINICSSPLQVCIGLQPAVEKLDVISISNFWVANNVANAPLLCVGTK